MNLKEFFEENKKVALGFSGGVDSAYLLYAAIKYGADIKAYYVKSAFQPEFELEDAKRLAKKLDANMEILDVDVFENPDIVKNSSQRCYYCKKKIFSTIKNKALADGYSILLDGTNASDEYDDRPGMKAKDELKVLSPLRMAGLTKTEIRKLSKEAGLETWDKPSYSCLATRVLTDTPITEDKLYATEHAEEFMKNLGFNDFRVRNVNGQAKIQVRLDQMPLVLEKKEEILKKFKTYYKEVVLDLEDRK